MRKLTCVFDGLNFRVIRYVVKGLQSNNGESAGIDIQ
jgi:hypothetical protein